MTKVRTISSVSMAVVAAALTILLVQPADAQQRKSIRWATSQRRYLRLQGRRLDDEDGRRGARRRIHRHRQSLSVRPPRAMKAAMDGNGEIGYTADIGMTRALRRRRRLQELQAGQGQAGPHLVRLSDGIVHGGAGRRRPRKYKCLKDFSGKPVFFTPAGFMNWLNFQRIYKALGYDFKHVQIDPKTQSDALQAGTIVGSVAYTTSGASLVPYWKETEIRMDVAVVNPCPDEVAKLKAGRPGGRRRRSEGRVHQERRRAARSRACRSCSPTTCAPTCRKTSSTGCSTPSTRTATSWRRSIAGFAPLAKDFVGMQVAGINANPDDSGASRPRQVPEGAQGLGRQVEDRRQRQLIAERARRGAGLARDAMPRRRSGASPACGVAGTECAA